MFLKGHIQDHVAHVCVYIMLHPSVYTILTALVLHNLFSSM